jgi:WD40 repeat protein
LAQNRYTIVANNLKEQVSNCKFLGGNPLNPFVLIVQDKAKQINIYESASGKIVQTIQVNLHHSLEIKHVSVCNKKSLVITASADACCLWSLNSQAQQNSILKKVKSLPANQGKMFVSAQFSRCNENVVTLLKDGTVDLWNIDALNGIHN